MKSDPEELQEVRRWLHEVGEATGLGEEAIFQMKVAVSEACTNIIRHAYLGDHAKPIWLRAQQKGDGVELEIRDFGRPFDPSLVRAPDLEGAHEGGYGVFLMHNLMDHVEYLPPPDGGGTTLRMLKSRTA